MRHMLWLISATIVTWWASGLAAQAAERTEPGWRSGTVQVAPSPSSRRQWLAQTPDVMLDRQPSRPVTLIQPYVGRLSYDCEDQTLAAPARLPVPPPDVLPISAAETVAEPSNSMQLTADDPARVILEIRDQVGPNLFAGTIFQDGGEEYGYKIVKSAKTESTDQRAVLVRCIRDLEQTKSWAPPACVGCDDQCECCTGGSTVSYSPDAVQSLRSASRQLQEVAELLEEQNLYDRADQLRDMATELRQQARDGAQTLAAGPRND